MQRRGGWGRDGRGYPHPHPELHVLPVHVGLLLKPAFRCAEIGRVAVLQLGFWASHEEPAGNEIQEHRMNPTGHFMGAGRSMVHIEHKHGYDYGEGDKYHGEEQVLSDEWNDQRRRGNDFSDEQ